MRKKYKRKPITILLLLLILFLTSCQKTTPFRYDPQADLLGEAEKIISGPGVDFDVRNERIPVITAAFNGSGEGILQQFQMMTFGTANVATVPGGSIVISVPWDPQDGSEWQLLLNEHKASSRAYLPDVYKAKSTGDYHRLNFLLQPSFDSEVLLKQLSLEGDEIMVFRVAIQGIGSGEPQ